MTPPRRKPRPPNRATLQENPHSNRHPQPETTLEPASVPDATLRRAGNNKFSHIFFRNMKLFFPCRVSMAGFS